MIKRETIKTAARITFTFLILAAFSLAPAVNMTPRAHAQLLTGEIPYGGHQLFWFPCTCSASTLHIIFDYRTLRPLSLVYQPGFSILYLYYNVFGTYLLGSYQPSGECRIYVGYSCVSYPAEGIMGNRPGTGTSLY